MSTYLAFTTTFPMFRWKYYWIRISNETFRIRYKSIPSMKDPHTNEFIGSIGYRNQIRSHVIWPYRAKSVLYVLIPT